MAEPDFEEVGEFGHGTDCRPCRFDRIALLNGDGRPDVFDRIQFRAVQKFEKLTRVGAKCFDVAPLAFGVQGFEYEGRLTGAAQPGDNNEFAEWQIQVETLEVVLADSL